MPYRIRRRMGMGRTGREARIAGQGQGARVTHRAPATSKHNDTATTPFHRAQAVNAQSGPMMLTHARTRARHTHTHTHTHTHACSAVAPPRSSPQAGAGASGSRDAARPGRQVEGGGREEGRGEKRVEDARRRTRGGGRRGVGRQKRSDALGSRRGKQSPSSRRSWRRLPCRCCSRALSLLRHSRTRPPCPCRRPRPCPRAG